jgi:tetratricopeptide (TPR) repeat protein
MSLWKKLFSRQDRPRAEKLLEQGFIHAKKGRLKEALVAYEQSAAADESFAHAWLNQGLTLQDQYNARAGKMAKDEAAERLAAIAERLERAVALEVGLYQGWRCLGHVSRRLQRYARAEECFDNVLQYAPSDFEHRGEAKKQLKAVRWRAEQQRALERVKALAADTDASDDAMSAALDEIKRLQDKRPDESDDDEGTLKGDTLVGGKRETPQALVIDAPSRWAMAVLQRRLGDAAAARASLLAVLEDEPRHLGAHRDLASIALATGELDDALKHSMAAYREDPVDAGLVCNVGVCHLSLGRLKEAGEFLQMALDLDPKDPIVVRAHAQWEKTVQQAGEG